MPLWPKLRKTLRLYLKQHEGGPLLFPSERGTKLEDIRASLSLAVATASIAKRVTPTTFRHTYAAARLQTLDYGQPVSLYTVMRELGHSSLTMLERHYGHLMTVRHRKPVVEYVDNAVHFPAKQDRAS